MAQTPVRLSDARVFEQFTSEEVALFLGLVTGLIFGAFAQQSRFCLRAACIEFWRNKPGAKFSIWLFTFFYGAYFDAVTHAQWQS